MSDRLALEAVAANRIFKWQESGMWARNGVTREEVSARSLDRLLEQKLIELAPPTEESWRNVALTKAGREALEGVAA